MYIIVGEKWSYPDIQIDPNGPKSNQIKSNRTFLHPNQIKSGARFDLIYLFASLIVITKLPLSWSTLRINYILTALLHSI